MALPDDARESFVTARAGHDSALRAELLALLQAGSGQQVVDAIERGLMHEADTLYEPPETTWTTVGHYQIERELGRGGMGVVYLATDTRLDRRVALKLLPRAAARDPSRMKRFEREARAAAALNHPGIVTLHSLEEADGHRFLTMEFVAGTPLVIPHDGFDLTHWLDFSIQLSAAVAVAHRVPIVHRDLKPLNVLVTAENRLKVCDFGLAKLGATSESGTGEVDENGSSTSPGAVMGTVPYMSPEQTRGDVVDVRSDVFSLGTMLWEMATGRRPFRGSNRANLTAAILRDEPPPIHAERPEFDPALSALVARCLAKDPANRLGSAAALHAELLAVSRRDAKHAGDRSKPVRKKPVGVTSRRSP